MVSVVRLPSSLLSVASVLRSAPAIAFSGSRSLVPEMALCSLLPLVPPESRLLVGCARGVDAFVREHCPGVLVFRASHFGSGVGALVRRSAAMVGACAGMQGLVVGFPGRACPSPLVPSASVSQCFCGLGSGTWGTLALAAGLGCPILLFLPSPLVPPASWGSDSLSWESFGGGWYFWPEF